MFRFTSASRRDARKGSTAIEVAFFLPLLLLLFLGGIELSLLAYDQQILSAATREAARSGAMFKNYEDLTTLGTSMNDRWGPFLISLGDASTDAPIGVDREHSNACTATGERVQVVGTFQYTFITPFLDLVSDEVTLRSVSSMVCE